MPQRAKPLKNDFPIKGTEPRWFYRQICSSSQERNTQAQTVPECRNVWQVSQPLYKANITLILKPEKDNANQNHSSVYENETHTFLPGQVPSLSLMILGPCKPRCSQLLEGTGCPDPYPRLPRTSKCTSIGGSVNLPARHPQAQSPAGSEWPGTTEAGASCP